MITRISGRLKTDEMEDRICHMIISSELKDGAPIPSENLLCEQFGVSRITVRSALAKLVERKVLRTERGRGSFVASADRARTIYGKDYLNRLVGILLPSIGENYFGSIAQAFESVMRKSGFNTIFSVFKTEGWEEGDYIEELNLSRIDGLVIAPWESAPLSPTIRKAIKKFKNVVLVNEPIDEPELYSVSSDDVEGASQAVKYLLSLGHRRIAHIRGPSNVLSAGARFNGYRETLESAGLFSTELVTQPTTYLHEEGASGIESLLALANPPTAVFCANDGLASGALSAARRKGVRVPQDLSIIGYGNSIDSMDKTPRLSSVEQGGGMIGRQAAELLLDLLFKRNPASRHFLIPPRLVIRESCTATPLR